MTENIGSGTAGGLVDYLDSLVEKGRSRVGVITPLKTALVKILEKTEGDDWEKVDVAKLDVDDVIARFKNFTLGTYTDASYRAYELRMKRAINWYNNFLKNPGWYPKSNRRNSKKVDDSNGKKTARKINDNGPDTQSRQSITHTSQSNDQVELPKIDSIAYPFPLANGQTARVYIPMGITKADVKRMSTFLEALVIEEEAKLK